MCFLADGEVVHITDLDGLTCFGAVETAVLFCCHNNRKFGLQLLNNNSHTTRVLKRCNSSALHEVAFVLHEVVSALHEIVFALHEFLL